MGIATNVSVKAVFHDADSKILVLTRSLDSHIGPGQLDLPGGKVLRGEQLEAALQRELHEELGFEPVAGYVLGGCMLDLPGRELVVMVLDCGMIRTDIRLSAEHRSWQWMTVDDARVASVGSFMAPVFQLIHRVF